MSTKPETTFYRAVHKHLPPQVYPEKMFNPYRGGTPDVWYSGSAADLWIEYKWIDHLPRSTQIQAALSPKQRQWINRRHSEGRRVGVILGCRDGGVIFTDGTWNESFDTPTLAAQLQTRKALAKWIEGVTCAGLELSWRPPL